MRARNGMKTDISDGSNPSWCIYRRYGHYVVSAVQSRVNNEVLAHVEPSYGPFKKISEARKCYSEVKDD